MITLVSDDVMELVLGERESINHLSYLLLIIMAFFGPNADLLGNIKLPYDWLGMMSTFFHNFQSHWLICLHQMLKCFCNALLMTL